MKGSEFVQRFGDLPAAMREAKIFDLVREGSFVRWPWKSVVCSTGPFHGTFYAATDYFAIGEPSDFVRMPLTPLLAQRIADLFGWSLPTKSMVDYIWNAADIHVPPILETPDAGMVSVGRFATNSRKIQDFLATLLPPRVATMLVAGQKKDIVLTNRLVRGRVAIYGWHKLNGIPIQGLNPVDHDDQYMDYSHGVRFVRGDMLVNDSPMRLIDVFSSPELSKLVSNEGILRVTRQPGTETKMTEILKRGSKGVDVGTWQTFLNEHGFRDADGKKLVADGDFGARTEFATKTFQATVNLETSGQVTALTLAASIQHSAKSDTDPPPTPVVIDQPVTTLPAVTFIQAKHFTKANRTAIDVVVIHDMEYPEKPTGAEWCAGFFQNPMGRDSAGNVVPVNVSAHYCVDNNSVVQCVLEKDVAHHAPGANHNGIGIEHAGYAAQTRAQWLDEYSMAELKVSARLTADICRRWGIPMEKVSAADLVAKKRGICGHADITEAFQKGKGHHDPGPNFPWDIYIDLVRAAGAAS